MNFILLSRYLQMHVHMRVVLTSNFTHTNNYLQLRHRSRVVKARLDVPKFCPLNNRLSEVL